MRKLLVLLLVAPLLFSSCSSDDDKDLKKDIVGTWKLDGRVSKEVVTNNTKVAEAIKKNIAESLADYYAIITFNSDGTFEVENFVVEKDGTLKDHGSESGTYTIKGNSLTTTTIYEDDEPYTSTAVVGVDGNTLRIEYDVTDEYDDVKFIEYLAPGEKDVVVTKVTTQDIYKRK